MTNEIRMNALKDPDKTFDLARFRAMTEAKPVVVIDGKKATMQFDAQGNFSEVQTAPLKATVALRLFTSLKHLPVGKKLQRCHRGMIATLATLRDFELRGGRI